VVLICLIGGCLVAGCSGSLVVPKWAWNVRSNPPGQWEASVGGNELVVTGSLDPAAMGRQALNDSYSFIETAVNGAVDLGRGVWANIVSPKPSAKTGG